MFSFDNNDIVSTWLDGLGWMSRLPNELRSFAGTGQGRKLVFFYALFVRGNMSIYFFTYNAEQDKSHRLNLPDGVFVPCCHGLNLTPVCI